MQLFCPVLRSPVAERNTPAAVAISSFTRLISPVTGFDSPYSKTGNFLPHAVNPATGAGCPVTGMMKSDAGQFSTVTGTFISAFNPFVPVSRFNDPGANLLRFFTLPKNIFINERNVACKIRPPALRGVSANRQVPIGISR